MSLSRYPQQIEARLPENPRSAPWTRSLAAGTLLSSAILLAFGRRKTALVVAAAGGAVALLEDPDGVRKFWSDIPGYVQAGQRMLARFEGVIEQVAEQGDSLKDIFRRTTERL